MVMRKIYVLIAAAMLVACGCLFASQADARVCFATDPDCGSGGNFGNMDDLKKYDDTCNINGYDQTSCEPGRLKYVCPYKSSWLKCCDPDYNYANCSYPLKIYGECGGKYKCVCDGSKYKYSYDGAGGSSMCINNSTPGGTSCVHQVANSAKNGLDIQTFYTECKCDRALYPYTPDICDENAEVGDTCIAIDSTGATSRYFSACYCDRKIYQYSAAGCSPYVGDETRGKCSSGGTTYYKTCKSCDGYPAQNLDHVGYNNGTPEPEDYEVCPYRQVGAEYKILACRDPGYRVSKNGDYDVDENGERIKDKNGNYVRLKAGEKCIPMECEDAVKYFVGKMPSYGYFNGTSLVDQNGASVSRTMAVIAKDISVGSRTCYGGTTASKRLCTKFCCKYKVKSQDETDWGDDELGVAIKKKKCTKSCCLSDGSNSVLVPGVGGVCEEGVTTVTPDTWGIGTNLMCLKGSSRVCTEVEETTEYDKTEITDGDTEYEEDKSCVSKAYDMTYISTPETCYMPSGADAGEAAFNCSELTTTTVSSVSKGLGCTDATSYYSAMYLAKSLGTKSDGAKALNVACKKVPTLTYTGATFPNGSSSSGSINLYGLNLKFSGTSNMGTRTVYLYDTNLQIGGKVTTQNGVYLERRGYVNDGNLKVSGTNGISNGELLIKNIFKSTDYSYDIRRIEIATNLNTAVFFNGGTSMKNFDVNEFKVNGLAGFKNFNVYAHNTNIGAWLSKSGISLYNTNWYMYRRESYTAYYLWMKSMAYLGTPTGCGDSNFSGSGVKIIFSNDRVYKALAGRDKQYNGEDNHRPKDHVGSVPYITEGGYYSYRTCTNKGTNLLCAGAGHHHSGSGYEMDWKGDTYDMTWGHKHGCGKCVY